MLRLCLAFGILSIYSVSLAQQPQQNLTPSQLAIMITNSVNSLSMRVDVLEQQNAQLQSKINELTKERDELKAKLTEGQKQ